MNNSLRLVDYDKWYEKAWASGLLKGIMAEYEVTPVRILRNDEDPNHVIVVLTAQSLEAFDKLRADPRVQALVSDRSIVAVPPQSLGRYTATEIADLNPAANYGFHVEHKLVDYDKWFAIFKDSAVRKHIEGELGIKAISVALLISAAGGAYTFLVRFRASREGLLARLNASVGGGSED